MECKVEVFNRGDVAVEVHNGQHDQVLQPGDRVTFDASEGLGIGPMVVQDNSPEPTPGDDIGGEHAHDPIPDQTEISPTE